MTDALDQYHRLAAQAFDAWDRLIGDPNSAEAAAEVAALEGRMDELEPEIIAIAKTVPAFGGGEWPDWMLELAGVEKDEGESAPGFD